MNGNKVLLDTNVLINYSKNLVSTDLLNSFDECCISIITYMEMYGYPFAVTDEKLMIDANIGLKMVAKQSLTSTKTSKIVIFQEYLVQKSKRNCIFGLTRITKLCLGTLISFLRALLI